MPVYRYRVRNGWRYMVKVCFHRKQYLRRGYLDRASARKAEALLISSPEKIARVPKLSVVLDGFLLVKETQVKQSTFYQIQHRCNIYILGKLPDVSLDRISFGQLSLWWTSICKTRLKIKNNILSLLFQVFDYASIFLGYSRKEYKKLLPYKDFSVKEISTGKDVLSSDDFRKIYDYEEKEVFRLYFLVSYFTGMRIGEVRGLQAKCFDGKHLFVFQQCSSKTGKGNFVSSLKTKSSVRYYLLPGFISSRLSSWIGSNGLEGDDFVFFSSKKSNVLSQNTFVRELNRITGALKIHHVNPHMFRHSEATLLFDNNVPLDQISKYLGHSSSSVTSHFYIHETDEKQKEISDLLQKKFGGDFSS